MRSHQKLWPLAGCIQRSSHPEICWLFLLPQAASATPSAAVALPDVKAWEIIYEFVTSEMRLPQAKDKLGAYLGCNYKEEEWRGTFKAVMDAENDSFKALNALDKLTMPIFNMPISQLSKVSTTAPRTPTTAQLQDCPAQLVSAENDLMECVKELKAQKRIIGDPLTLEDMLNPIEEMEIGKKPNIFEGSDAQIVEKVRYEMAVEKDEILEPESDNSDNGEPEELPKTSHDVMKMCEELEVLCIRFGAVETSLDLVDQLQQFCSHLRSEMCQNMKQTTLEGFWAAGA